MSPAERIAAELHDLIQRSPRTPSKAQLVDCIETMLDVVKDDAEAISVPIGTVVQPIRAGAFVRVEANMSLTLDGWHINSPRQLTTHEAALAILDWMKRGVLTAPRQ